MVRTMNEIEILNAALAVGWVKFAYFKADGSKRIAIGTRNRALIEQVLGRVLKENGSDGSFYENCNGYFDLIRVNWRQFKSERFIGIEFDRLDNIHAVAQAVAVAKAENENFAELQIAVGNLVGIELAMPIICETDRVMERISRDIIEDGADVNGVVSVVCSRFPIVEITMEQSANMPQATSKSQAERTAKVNSCRAALKAELAALRKREDEILQLLLAD